MSFEVILPFLRPIERLIRDDAVSEIMVNGSSAVFVERHEQQLPKMNRVRYRGEEHPFSESNIYNVIQALKSELFDGLTRTNEKVYDLLCLGKAMQ